MYNVIFVELQDRAVGRSLLIENDTLKDFWFKFDGTLVVVMLVEQKMRAVGWAGGKYLIDGFPRSQNNLDGWVQVMGDSVKVEFCLFFEVSEAVMTERLLERGKTSGRSDDNAEAIKKRFVTFRTESLPVVEKYRKAGTLVGVNAERSIDAVWKHVQVAFRDGPAAANKPSVVFVLGGPGSEQDTQCARISETLGYVHLSAGDLLREERAKESSAHKDVIESCIKEGKLVPVEITVMLIEQKMQLIT